MSGSAGVEPRGRAGWVVRKTSAPDVEAVLDLLEAVASEGRWIATEAPIDRPARRERILEALADPDAGSFVAEAGGRIVGSAGIRRPAGGAVPPSFGMMVAETWRRRGIGAGLLLACIDWARSVGAHKVALEVWPDNAPAIAFYERHGFRREGYLRRHYRRRNGELWDTVVMGLLL